MKILVPVSAALFLACCAGSLSAQPALKDAYQSHFLIGAALNSAHYASDESTETRLIKTHFNVITPENGMKWASLQPRPGQYDFRDADRFVEFGRRNGLYVIGHTLVWHQQTPAWVFQDAEGKPLTREALLARMRDHIFTVVGRYKGRVHGWDVVNEALDEDGSLRDSPWRRIIGDDFVEKAFAYAREADPRAHLYYNDYRLEHPPKRDGAIALLKKLKNAGVHVDGVGIQEHVSLTWPRLEDLDASIAAFGRIGLQVMITELDVDVLPGTKGWGDADIRRQEAVDPALDPYGKGLPSAMQEKLARRYADLFRVYLKHRDTVSRVTFWGLNDGDSWLNNWPIKGRTSHPLLFDRDNRPKPALQALLDLARSAPTSSGPNARP